MKSLIFEKSISSSYKICYGPGLERPGRGAGNMSQVWVHTGHGSSDYIKGDNIWQHCQNVDARLSQCYRKVSNKKAQYCRNVDTTTPDMSIFIRNTRKDYITIITFSILEASLNNQFNSYCQLDLTKHRITIHLPS